MRKKDITKSFGGPSELVFWSFCYFFGRTTIHTCAFAESLAVVWPYLDDHIQELIQRELEREFTLDDNARFSLAHRIGTAKNEEERLAARLNTYLPLGRDCDRAAWEKVRAAYKKPVDS